MILVYFIFSDLSNDGQKFTAANRITLYTYNTRIVTLVMLINRHSSLIHLHNIYFCFKIELNLLLLRALKAKKLDFQAEHRMLHVGNPKKNYFTSISPHQ